MRLLTLVLLATALCLTLAKHYHGHDHSDHDHPDHKHFHHKRHLRSSRHIHSTFEDFAKEHLSWLSDDEQTEVKKLHDEDKQKARDKVVELLEASSGDKREKGIAQLSAACRELIVNIFGESVANELKSLKEAGKTHEELSAKVAELLSGITDEAKKAKALEHKYVCEKVYSLKKSSKKRRSAAHHDLESKLRNEWNWLTNEQKEEVRKLKTDGKGDEFLLTKVFEYFKNADDKSAAEDGLQTSCGSAVLTILGPEKAEELKTFMANGAKPEAYEAKVKELLNSAPKKTLTKNQESCKMVFTSASRRRRHEGHHHTLEDYLESSHLAWLSQPEKESIRKLAQEGKSKEVIQKQVLEYYDATTGEGREKATQALQSGCRELFTHMVGAEKAGEMKKLKESGATNEELRAKGEKLIDEITDEKMKQEAKFYAVGCRKVFGVESKRKRHVHHHLRHKRDAHSLDSLFKTYLNWLSEEQQKKLLELKEAGTSREDLQKEVLKFYEAASGSVKEKARELMQEGCRKLLVRVFGEDKANEVKTLKESGTPLKDIAEKIKQWFAELTDEGVKKSAAEYSTVCNKAFDLE